MESNWQGLCPFPARHQFHSTISLIFESLGLGSAVMSLWNRLGNYSFSAVHMCFTTVDQSDAGLYPFSPWLRSPSLPRLPSTPTFHWMSWNQEPWSMCMGWWCSSSSPTRPEEQVSHPGSRGLLRDNVAGTARQWNVTSQISHHVGPNLKEYLFFNLTFDIVYLSYVSLVIQLFVYCIEIH